MTNAADTLLAKSASASEPALSLKQHIDDCLVIWEQLQRAFNQRHYFEEILPDFWQLLRICVIFHDTGKAHQEFQKVLKGEPNQWSAQRHELFSLPFVDAFAMDKPIRQLIRLVVAGHHKNFDDLTTYLKRYASDDSSMLAGLEEENSSFEHEFATHVDIEKVTDLLRQYQVSLSTVEPKPVEGVVRSYLKTPYNQSHAEYFKLLLLFGGMKHCDHLGSARVTHISTLEPKDFQFLHRSSFSFYQHQQDCALIHGNLILTAPTGSGKTESAFLWLENQMRTFGQGRVFYVLPFTASINAMYERLCEAIEEENANEKVGMLHGKLSDYLNDYFQDFQYSISEKKEEISKIREKFRTLSTPVKVVTPFQLLKHLFGLKGFEQGIFEWTGSYFIFDEIHAYSPEVFAQIKVLLEFATKHLHTKVMIMTATLPTFLRKELESAVGPFTQRKADDALYQSFRRHQVILREGLLSESLDFIKEQVTGGKKVLIVCNTVNQVQQVFNELKDAVAEDAAVLLHSGFNGRDRSQKEKLLKKESVRLLVGTQAIEVSLDIDYDLIFTEPAPIDALLQRFGRVNRKRSKEICPCYVFNERNEGDKFIYADELVERTLTAFEQLQQENNGVIDEAQLQPLIDFVYPDWAAGDGEKFKNRYDYLKTALHDLFPLKHSKRTEEEFYRQFDGIKVLPQTCKDEFIDCLNRFDFISAESLKVQIRQYNFARWRRDGSLKPDKYIFETQKGKVIEIPYFITNKPYSNELGLMSKAAGESWQDDVIW